MICDYHLHLAADDVHLGEEHFAVERLQPYLATARERGVAEIAITEHVYRFAAVRALREHEYWQEWTTADLDGYVRLLEQARAAGLPVLAGLELDWLGAERSAGFQAVLAAADWDVILGSVHWLDPYAVDHPDFAADEELEVEELWARYFAALGEAAASGLYDVMAHPDLVKVFGRLAPEELRRSLYEDAAERLAAAGVCAEVSTAGLHKRIAELYPAPAFLRALRRAGVPVTLASDAHAAENVGRDFDQALAALHEAGYRTLTQFRGRDHRQVSFA